MPTRAEHLEWCKVRALAYVDRGDLDQAFASFASDLRKHPDTAGSGAPGLWARLLLSGYLTTTGRVREFIESCC